MRKKESLKIIVFFIILVCSIIVFLVFKEFKKGKIKEEYIPEEEISQEQERQTMITLYFKDKEENKLIPEVRKIDSKKLLIDPYKYLLEELHKGPKNEKLKMIIPENTKINNIKLDKDVLIIDFSKEFIEKSNEEDKKLNIEAILKTMSELNEINGIKIIIDGEENNEKNNLENIYYID